MTSLHIPDKLGTLVRRQAKESGYRSADAYARDVLMADQKRRAGEKLAALLQEGRDSGFIEADEPFWEKLSLDLEAAIQSGKKK